MTLITVSTFCSKNYYQKWPSFFTLLFSCKQKKQIQHSVLSWTIRFLKPFFYCYFLIETSKHKKSGFFTLRSMPTSLKIFCLIITETDFAVCCTPFSSISKKKKQQNSFDRLRFCYYHNFICLFLVFVLSLISKDKFHFMPCSCLSLRGARAIELQ